MSNVDDDVSEDLPTPRRTIATTIELPLFLIMLSVNLTGPAVSNIILYKTCVHSLNYSVEECKPYLSPIKSNETVHIEDEVQRYSTHVMTVKVVLEYVFPAILSLFLGVWSDTYGRKPLIVWPSFGLSLMGILIVIFGMMDSLGPWWFILTAVPFSITGGFIVLFTGAYCYVSDTSTPSTTSLRMTMIDATTSLGSVAGSMICSYLILTIGNTNLLLMTATLNVIAYAFTNIWIVESLNGALQGGISKIFDFLLVKEMVRDCFKERPNRQRTQILLLSLVRILLFMVLFGTLSLEYLYTRQKLHWSLREYTTYSAVSTLVTCVGGFFGIMVVQKLLGIGDISFTIITLFMATAESLIKLFAVKTWHMYLSSGISMFKGLSGALIRSFLTKTLPVEDIAKVFFLICAAESFGPIICPIIFNSLYAYTLSTFPGAIYALSTVLTVVCIILLGIVQYLFWNRDTSNYEQISNIDT